MNPIEPTIRTTRSSVAPLVSEAIAHSDRDKDALGFLPAAVFHEFAIKEQLFVAVSGALGAPSSYVGHILFDCRYPRCSILQVNVVESMRRSGVGRKLVCTLRDHLTSLSFTSISARVAADLPKANSFYQAL